MKKYQVILMVGLILIGTIVLLSVFMPEFIKGTPLSAVLENDNLDVVLLLVDIIITMMLVFFQDREKKKNTLLAFSSMEPQWEPGCDTVINSSPWVSTLLPPNNAESGNNGYLVQVYRSEQPKKNVALVTEAKVHTEVDIRSITFSKLRVKFENNTINLKHGMPKVFRGKFWNLKEVLEDGETIPLYFSLILDNDQHKAICDSIITVLFHEKIRTVQDYTIKKKVRLKFLVTKESVRLLEQY